jgi:acetyl-CoA carboxylase biotin carboxyl carrier protein
MDTLKALVRLMNEQGLAELEVADNGKRIHLRRTETEKSHPAGLLGTPFAPPAAASHLSNPHPLLAREAPPAPAPAREKREAPPSPSVKEVKSPMVGTFYGAPAPDAAPFASVGDKVTEETVLCIIEAMKVMNEIKADCRGEIVKVLVANGESVEYGQPLFQVKTG